MKKHVLLFWFTLVLLLFFRIQASVGQNPLVKQWDHCFGGLLPEGLGAFQQTPDGGYIIGGYSNSGISGDKTCVNWGDCDYWIVKTDSNGTRLWDNDFGGTNTEYLYCLEQTLDGGYITGGYSNSDSSGNKVLHNWGASNDYWIVKTDNNGNKKWERVFGGTDDDQLFAIIETSDGGFLFGGTSFSGIGGDKTVVNWGGSGDSDFWIVKTDSSGNLQWDKHFGGTEADCLFSINRTFDGGCILGGYSMSGASGDKSQPQKGGIGDTDYWIVKLDSLYNKQWDKSFGGISSDKLYSVQQTTDEGYILWGYSISDSSGDKTQNLKGGSDFWIVKTDVNGNKKWDKDFGGSAYETAMVGNLMQTKDGGYLFSGTSTSNASGDKSQNNLSTYQIWTIKTDSSGIKQWDNTLLTNSAIGDLSGLSIQTSDGGYAIAVASPGSIGGDKTENCRGYEDFWVVKFIDSSGIGSSFISSDTTFCDKQYIDFYDQSTNNPTSWQWLFPGGVPSSSMLQNPVGIYYNSYGSFDVTLIACNASGCDTLYLPNFIHEFPSPPVPVVTWSADTLFSTPAFSYQWYFNSSMIPGATGQYYVFQQPGDYFVIITDSNGCSTPSTLLYTGIVEVIDNGDIYVIPNPTDGNFVLYGAQDNAVIKIIDVAGQELYSGIIKSSPQQIFFKASPGVYIMEIAISGRLVRKKIVVGN